MAKEVSVRLHDELEMVEEKRQRYEEELDRMNDILTESENRRHSLQKEVDKLTTEVSRYVWLGGGGYACIIVCVRVCMCVWVLLGACLLVCGNIACVMGGGGGGVHVYHTCSIYVCRGNVGACLLVCGNIACVTGGGGGVYMCIIHVVYMYVGVMWGYAC